MDFIAPNLSGDEKPERKQYAISFRVRPVVSPDEYRRLFWENVRIKDEREDLYHWLEKKGVPRGKDRFLGKTDEEKAAADRYEALGSSMHSLPDYYFGNISLKWIIGSPALDGLFGDYVVDDRIREECLQSRKKIMELLSPYEDAAPR